MQRVLTLLIPSALAVGLSALSIGAADAAALGGFYTPPHPTFERVQYRGDCHNFTHNHYVPEWGVVTPHHHQGPDCIPIQDENDDDIPDGYYRDNSYGGGRYFNYGASNGRYHRRHYDDTYYGCDDDSQTECLSPEDF